MVAASLSLLGAAPVSAASEGHGYLALGDSVPFGFSPLKDPHDASNFVGYPEIVAVNGDKVYQFDPASQTYFLFTRRATTWSPSEPSIGANAAYANVAEGFFLQAASAGSWTRTFTVN